LVVAARIAQLTTPGIQKDSSCCCGPGSSIVSSILPNVLIIGDSVSDGYIPFVQKAMNCTANVQHGPDNSGGGCADNAVYGQLCTKYFVRTPLHELPPWDVMTFNYGLHDAAESNASWVLTMCLQALAMPLDACGVLLENY
jgi:hypothetical protein